MIAEYKKLQEAIILKVAQSIEEPWERIVINYEMLYGEDGIQHDQLGFYITKVKPESFEKRQLEFSDAISNAFVELNDASQNVNNNHWTVCDLVIDGNGKYEINFSYDEPKRINAILDEQSYFRFSKYLETYKASLKK